VGWGFGGAPLGPLGLGVGGGCGVGLALGWGMGFGFGAQYLENTARFKAAPSLMEKVGRKVREAAEDAKEDGLDPVATLVARADPVWPAPAAQALAALILRGLHHRADRRPADMATVLAILREVDFNIAKAKSLAEYSQICWKYCRFIRNTNKP
jgi:dienelactone hydrolase